MIFRQTSDKRPTVNISQINRIWIIINSNKQTHRKQCAQRLGKSLGPCAFALLILISLNVDVCFRIYFFGGWRRDGGSFSASWIHRWIADSRLVLCRCETKWRMVKEVWEEKKETMKNCCASCVTNVFITKTKRGGTHRCNYDVQYRF